MSLSLVYNRGKTPLLKLNPMKTGAFPCSNSFYRHPNIKTVWLQIEAKPKTKTKPASYKTGTVIHYGCIFSMKVTNRKYIHYTSLEPGDDDESQAYKLLSCSNQDHYI